GPGRVDGLLFGPGQPQARSNQRNAQGPRLSALDESLSFVQLSGHRNEIQAAPARAYAMANQKTMWWLGSLTVTPAMASDRMRARGSGPQALSRALHAAASAAPTPKEKSRKPITPVSTSSSKTRL